MKNIINKLRRLLYTIQILDKVEENNKILKELNWSNVFNNTISNSEWFIKQNISPGRWAIGYPLFYILYRILDEIKPNIILEFGLGQSTKMLAQYCLYNKNAYLTSIEHDKTWIQKYIENNNIPDNVEIKYHKNEAIFINNKKSLSVNNLVNTTANIKYDLIVVDAPYGSDNYSRPQILKLIPNNIKRDSFCIIIDDYNRTGEKETVRELEKVLSNNSIDFEKGIYSGEKESIVICSPKFRHILTL